MHAELAGKTSEYNNLTAKIQMLTDQLADKDHVAWTLAEDLTADRVMAARMVHEHSLRWFAAEHDVIYLIALKSQQKLKREYEAKIAEIRSLLRVVEEHHAKGKMEAAQMEANYLELLAQVEQQHAPLKTVQLPSTASCAPAEPIFGQQTEQEAIEACNTLAGRLQRYGDLREEVVDRMAGILDCCGTLQQGDLGEVAFPDELCRRACEAAERVKQQAIGQRRQRSALQAALGHSAEDRVRLQEALQQLLVLRGIDGAAWREGLGDSRRELEAKASALEAAQQQVSRLAVLQGADLGCGDQSGKKTLHCRLMRAQGIGGQKLNCDIC
jgi:hypothetical protein